MFIVDTDFGVIKYNGVWLLVRILVNDSERSCSFSLQRPD